MTSTVDGPGGPSRARRVAEALGLVAPFLLWAVFVVTPVWFQTAQLCFAHYDLGIYTQALARMSLDDPNPWLSARQVRIFNDHFDPILWLAKPLVPVLSAMWAAVVTETLLVLLSTVPILWLHRRGQLDRLSTTLLCALLLLSPATTDAVKFAIHPTTWTMLPFVLLGVAFHLRKNALLLVSLVLLFACKEEFPFVGLMVAVALWLRGERRLAVGVAVLAVAWLGFVNVVRPWWMGPVEDYGARLRRGMDVGLVPYLAERLAPKQLSRVVILALLFVPVGIWAWRERLKPDWTWFLVLLPMLGIRFLGMAWRHQYGAPLSVALVMGILPLLLARRPPAWVLGVTGLLLVTTNETALLKKLGPTLVARSTNPPICPADPGRMDSVHRAVDVLAAHPEGKALLNGNLVSPLAARGEVYAVGGPQPSGKWTYDWVLVEKPPLGNGEPATPADIQALIERWRAQEGTQILMDDAYVFLARGRFSDAL